MITTVHDILKDSRVFYKMACSIASVGHTVEMIAPYNKAEIFHGVKIYPLPGTKRRLQRLLLQSNIFKIARKTNADIYHLHDPELLLLGCLLSSTGRVTIMDMHENVHADILSKPYIPKSLRRAFALAYEMGERVLLGFCKGLVLAEDSYLKSYPRFFPKIVIHNFPMTKYVRPGTASYPLEGKPVQLVYVGTISRSRGIFDIVKSLPIIRNARPAGAHLHLMGPQNDPKEAKALSSLIRDLGLKSSVTLHGNRPYPEVFDLLVNCQVGLAPLHNRPNYLTSLPTKVLEYMLMGLPVIASDFPINRSYVLPPQAGLLVEAECPEAIATAVLEIISDRDRFLEMGRNGQRRVLSNYSWEGELERLVAFYRSIVLEPA